MMLTINENYIYNNICFRISNIINYVNVAKEFRNNKIIMNITIIAITTIIIFISVTSICIMCCVRCTTILNAIIH